MSYRAIGTGGSAYPVNTDAQSTIAKAAMVEAGEVLEQIYEWPSEAEYLADKDGRSTGWFLTAHPVYDSIAPTEPK